MVDSVRSQRAMVALRMTGPKMGSFRNSRSMNICILGERFQACRKK